ncbi:MAG: pyridoxal-phosphate dependent enzyme, partial [archaeon]
MIFLDNKIHFKRDDNYGPLFGGNKARKLDNFIKEAKEQDADYLVTYGSVHSNHCRITASYAAQNDMRCLLILAEPDHEPKNTGNFFLYNLLDAEIVYTPVDSVSKNIDKELNRLRQEGYNPYFIQGGGHGNPGTHAYVEVSKEIK